MTKQQTFPTEIDGITRADVRHIREWVNGLNRDWVDSPRELPYSAYDREAGIRSRSADFAAQERNLAGFKREIARAFAPMVEARDDNYEILRDAQGRSIGVRCDLLDYYESEMGLVEPLETEIRMRRPDGGNAAREDVWDAAFYLYAHLACRGIYNAANTDWSKVDAAAWARARARADRAAGLAPVK